MTLTDEQIDLIANDGFRNVAGGIYATSVHDFARAIIAAAVPADSDYKRMFEDAVRSLASIDAALGIDPDEAGGAAPILEAIAKLKDRSALSAPVIADTAKPVALVAYEKAIDLCMNVADRSDDQYFSGACNQVANEIDHQIEREGLNDWRKS